MAERWFVAPEVAGSKPVAHPILPPLSQDEGVFVFVNAITLCWHADATMMIIGW